MEIEQIVDEQILLVDERRIEMARKTLKEVDLELLYGVSRINGCSKHLKYKGMTRPRVLSCAGCWAIYLEYLYDVKSIVESELGA